jgi:hypothetical protein
MAQDGKLRPIFRQNLPFIFWTSIETGMTMKGVPDSFAIKSSCAFWVEYKKTEANAVDLDPKQVAWHDRYLRCGGISFIAVRQQCSAGPRRPARDGLFLFRGADVKKLKAEGLRGAKPIGQWDGGPAKWDWKRIEILLLATKARK